MGVDCPNICPLQMSGIKEYAILPAAPVITTTLALSMILSDSNYEMKKKESLGASERIYYSVQGGKPIYYSVRANESTNSSLILWWKFYYSSKLFVPLNQRGECFELSLLVENSKIYWNGGERL